MVEDRVLFTLFNHFIHKYYLTADYKNNNT